MLTKSIGTQNPINLVKATMDGLTGLRRPEDVAKLRGLSVKQVLGLDLQEAAAKQAAASRAERRGAGDRRAGRAGRRSPADAPEAPSESGR